MRHLIVVLICMTVSVPCLSETVMLRMKAARIEFHDAINASLLGRILFGSFLVAVIGTTLAKIMSLDLIGTAISLAVFSCLVGLTISLPGRQ